MEKQEFINKIHSEYSSLFNVSKQDIEEMIHRGFLVADREYLQHYITHYDAFKKKFEKYNDTKNLLTADQLHSQLLEELKIDISEPEIVKMAELGLLKRGEDFRDVTVEADIIHKRNEDAVKGGLREKVAEIAVKDTHVYLFANDLDRKGYDFWFQLKNQLIEKLEALEQEEDEDELGLDEIDEDEDTDDKDKKSKKGKNGQTQEEIEEYIEGETTESDKTKKEKYASSASDRWIQEQREEEARRQEELRKQEEARRLAEKQADIKETKEEHEEYKSEPSSASYDPYASYETTNYDTLSGNSTSYDSGASSIPVGSDYVYNSVNIPLSDGSYITVAPANPGEGYKLFENTDTEAARIQAVSGVYDAESGKYQYMSQVGLTEVINYIKTTSADETVHDVPVLVTITKNDGQVSTLYNEATYEGSISEFQQAYYKNTEIPEYSNIDKKVQYAIGAVNFADGTHDDEFEIKEDEYGNKTVHWTPPEYITTIAPSVYNSISSYAQERYTEVGFAVKPQPQPEPVKYGYDANDYTEESSPVYERPVKHYEDISYDVQPQTQTNASPTSDTQYKYMDSGAGAYVSEEAVAVINTYREAHDMPTVNAQSITYEDVVSAPQEIQKPMAEAYYSVHPATYEQMQATESPVVGAVIEAKYAAQVFNSNVPAPTWAEARQAKADYDAGTGNGIAPAEQQIREKYESFEKQGYTPIYQPTEIPAYKAPIFKNIPTVKDVPTVNNVPTYNTPNYNNAPITQDIPTYKTPTSKTPEVKQPVNNYESSNKEYSHPHITGQVAGAAATAGAVATGAALAASIPVFVAFKNSDGSGKISVAVHEVKEYATSHVMNTVVKRDTEGNVKVTPYYQNFVAEKEIKAAQAYETRQKVEAFYASKQINKTKTATQPQPSIIKQPENHDNLINNLNNNKGYSNKGQLFDRTQNKINITETLNEGSEVTQDKYNQFTTKKYNQFTTSENNGFENNNFTQNNGFKPVPDKGISDKPYSDGNDSRPVNQENRPNNTIIQSDNAEPINNNGFHPTPEKNKEPIKGSQTFPGDNTSDRKKPIDQPEKAESNEPKIKVVQNDALREKTFTSGANKKQGAKSDEPVSGYEKPKTEVKKQYPQNKNGEPVAQEIGYDASKFKRQARQPGFRTRNDTLQTENNNENKTPIKVKVKPVTTDSEMLTNKQDTFNKARASGDIKDRYSNYVGAAANKKISVKKADGATEVKKGLGNEITAPIPITKEKVTVTKGVIKAVAVADGASVIRKQVSKDVRTTMNRHQEADIKNANVISTRSMDKQVGNEHASKYRDSTSAHKIFTVHVVTAREAGSSNITKNKTSQQGSSHVILPAAVAARVRQKANFQASDNIHLNDGIVNTGSEKQIINNNEAKPVAVASAEKSARNEKNNAAGKNAVFTNGGASVTNKEDQVASASKEQRVKTGKGTSVVDVPGGRISVSSIGTARKAGNTVINTTATGAAIATVGAGGVKAVTNRQGKVVAHVMRADKRTAAGSGGNPPPTRPVVPKAIRTVTVNIQQQGLTGRKTNTVLVLNSDRTGMMRTNNGKEVITGNFRGFASDLGKANTKATKTNRRMAIAEAYEKSRAVKSAVITINDKKLQIDPEWLKHNSKNINSSIGKFRLGKGKTKITRESAEELTGLIAQAINAGALRELKTKAPAHTKARTRATAGEDALSREDLAKYFKNSKAVMKQAEKKTKKQNRKQFWSATTALVTAAPFLDNDMAAGLQVIRNFNRNIEIMARAGQRASIKQKGVNINKNFMRSFVGNERFGIKTHRRPDLTKDGIGLVKNRNGVSRLEALSTIRLKVQGSETLRRSGIERMSVRDLSKLLKTGKLNGRALTEEEKSIIFNIVLLKTARSGRIQDINGVVLLNNKFKNLHFTGGKDGTYNFNKSKDISKALSELDKMSQTSKFRETLRGKRLSQFTDRGLRQLLKNKNLSAEDKELIQATLLLRAFKNEKKENENELSQFDNMKGAVQTVKQVFNNIIAGTVAGEGMAMATRYIYRTKTALKLVINYIGALRAAAVNRRLRNYARTRGIRGKLNNTKLSKWRQERLRIRREEGNLAQRTAKKAAAKLDEKTADARKRAADRIKNARTKTANKIKNKFNTSAVGKKFHSLKDSKFGKALGKVGKGAMGAAKIGKTVGKIGVNVPLKGIAFIQKFVSLKKALMQAIKKYAIIGLVGCVALTFVFTLMSAAYDAVTGFLYNNSTSFTVVEKIKNGEWSELVTSFTNEDEGDSTEYAGISATDTLINDRIQYCVGMDSALKEYIENFYTNEDIIDAVTDVDNKKIKDEEQWWYNPAKQTTFFDSLKEKKVIGTTVDGINTGLHYTYYDGDGNIISMRSNAKDIISVANTWIGTDLSAKGAYKTMVEKLWSYTHFVGYSLRENYGNYYIYSCNSHDEDAECHDNVVLYYCNKKKDGNNSKGTDDISEKMYEALNSTDGSTIHNGTDIQLYYNDTTGEINGALNATTVNKTIGKNTTVASGDESTQTRKDNVAEINSSYTEQLINFPSGSTFSYSSGGTSELIQMSYNYSSGMAADEADSTRLGSGTVDIDSTLSTADNVYKFLTETMGLSTEAACGVMGNIYAESGFDTTSAYTFTSGGKRYVFRGLCQWDDWNLSSDGRWSKGLAGALTGSTSNYMNYHYSDYSAKTKESLSDQLSLIKYELEHTESRVMSTGTVKDWKWGLSWTGLGAITEGSGEKGVEQATMTWGAIYERCYGSSSGVIQAQTKRINAAKDYYNHYKTGGVKAETTLTYHWPVRTNFVSPALFGTYASSGSAHKGIDINIKSPWDPNGSGISLGQPYYAAQSGKVIYAYNDGGYHDGFGNYVVVEHSDGSRTLYAHSQTVIVTVGQTVSQGQQLGTIGSTGNSTGPHLHFELRLKESDGTYVRVNPELYVVDPDVKYKITDAVATQKGERKNQEYCRTSTSDPVIGDTYTYTSGAGGTSGGSGGSTGGAVSTFSGMVDVLYRTSGYSKYGSIEKGSWAWVESPNGCTRHEPTYHLSGSGDVTSKVLTSGAAQLETHISNDNTVTLFPESTMATVKFYTSKPCSNYGTLTVSIPTTTNIDGTNYTTYKKTTVYYCKGHLTDDCDEKASKNSELTIETNSSYYHTTPNTDNGTWWTSDDDRIISSTTTSGPVTIYHMQTARYASSDDAKDDVPTYQDAFTDECKDDTGKTFTDSSAADANCDKVTNIKVHTENKLLSKRVCIASDYDTALNWTKSQYPSTVYPGVYYEYCPGYPSSEWKWNDLNGDGIRTVDELYMVTYYAFVAYQTVYYYTYDVFCTGHKTTKESTVESVYCTGYCCGHEMTEYCTGHVDLDVGVVTLYADESATNSIINLGVAKTADVTTSDGNYQAREENGKKEDGKTTVLTVESDSEDPNDYLFTNTANLDNLTKYVFKEFDAGVSTNSFPLPKVDSDMEYKYINNEGSFIEGDKIVRGINFMRNFITGNGLEISAHDTLSDKNDYDGDNKITLKDILAKAYACFAAEKYKDLNDDITVNTYANFTLMPTVAEKLTKDVHFIGFYEYIVSGDGTTAGLEKDADGEYVDTGNIARVHEAMKEDWLQLYQVEFPGAYNAVASDKEIQKLAFNVAAATKQALKNLGLSVTGTTYSEYTHNSYTFLDSIYKFPEETTQTVTDPDTGKTETVVTKKPRGTGFLSAWDENDNMKTTNCLGKPAYYENHSDAVNFALEWGTTFLKDLGLTNAANKYTQILNTSNYKNAYDYIKGYYDETTGDCRITETDIPQWIVDVYDGNTKEAMFRFNWAKMFDETLVKHMKTTYLRDTLMSESDFINGADEKKWGTDTHSNAFNTQLTKLKAGDLIGIGDEVYLVLYQDSGIASARNYYQNGEPIYTGDKHGTEKGKVYLITIGDVDETDTIQDNEIHLFAYSLELLNVKRASVWMYMPKS